MKSKILNFLDFLFSYIIYIIPWTLMLMGMRLQSFIVYGVILILFLIIHSCKKQNKGPRLISPLSLYEIVNMLAISFCFIFGYILILTYIPNELSYYNQFYYLNIFEYLNNFIYLIMAGIFIPLTEGIFIRRLLKKTKNNILKMLLIGINVFVICFIQVYWIYGIFFGLISLMSSIYLLLSKDLNKSIIFQIILNIVFCLCLLFLSEYKLLIIIISMIIFIFSIILNSLTLYTKGR